MAATVVTNDCPTCGAAHDGSAGRCPYVDAGVIPDWVDDRHRAALAAALRAREAP